MVSGIEDSEGQIVTGLDLLGRTIYYHDADWNETWTDYDNLGRLSVRTSALGTETFVYDNFHRLIQQKLDNVTYAVVSYDQWGRMVAVEYPNANGQKLVIGRDALGRVNSQTYYQGGTPMPGANILPNSSVEQADGNDPNKPDTWQTNAWGTNAAIFTYLNEGYTGNKSVKTEITSYTNGDAKWKAAPVAVSGGTTYTYKDYYRSNIQTEAVVEYVHQDQSVSYAWLGFVDASSNWAQASLNFTTPATATHATVLHYVNNVGWLIMDDAELFVSNTTGGQSVIASDAVVRSQSGQIISGTELGQSKTYTYDKAGRLTGATSGSSTFSYGFGTQSSSCGSGNNINPNAGKNSNRMTQTINSQTTTYCYDYADRLISSSDPLANNAQYDAHGNTTAIGSGTTPLQLLYDSSDRNYGLEQMTSAGTGAATYYGRDVENRVNYRETNTITNWNWNINDKQWYGFTGSADAPSIVRNASWDVVEKYLSLPGGVLLTIRPPQTGNANKVYSLSNIHGDVMATTDAAGTLTGAFQYDPFGNKLSANLPNNTATASTFAWVGQHQKITETSLTLTPIAMGARIYFPTLGRFAQVDPVEGGNENAYVYPTNPIGAFDLDGRICWSCGFKAAGSWVGKNADWIGTGVTVAGAAACIASVACGVTIGVGAGVSAAVATTKARYKGHSWAQSAGSGILSATIDITVGKVVNVAKIAKSAPTLRSRTIAVTGSIAYTSAVQSAGSVLYSTSVSTTKSILKVGVANTSHIRLTVVASSFRGTIVVR